MGISPLGSSPLASARRGSAVLVAACDGYPAGTTGRLDGTRQGCVVFVPDAGSSTARWASPRRTLLVPPTFLVAR